MVGPDGSGNLALTMPSARRAQPSALTVAGSDSGGGAGIQADLKVFHTLGIHGTSAITCLTCQNPREVRAVQPAGADIVRQQLEAVLDELPPRAIKTGMLYSTPIMQAIADVLAAWPRIPLVVDPVMVATSGAALLKPASRRALRSRILPLATLTTPNLDEASMLTQRQLSTPEHLRSGARQIHEEFGCAVLIKGGHLKGTREAIDIFYDGKSELLLTAPFVKGVHTHGTGCTLSAAITGYLALGHTLSAAVQKAKSYVTAAIVNSRRVGRHSVLGVPGEHA